MSQSVQVPGFERAALTGAIALPRKHILRVALRLGYWDLFETGIRNFGFSIAPDCASSSVKG
jgi:hypothetical protein